MRDAREDLEQYPLAKAYGWRAPMRDTGGILFLYPPVAERGAGKYNTATRKDRLEALDPRGISPRARDWTEEHYGYVRER